MKNLVVFMLLLSFIPEADAQSFKDEIESYRAKYAKELTEGERSPLKKRELKKLRWYEPDSSYRVEGEFIKTEGAEPFDIPTSSGKTKKYVEYGRIRFQLNGITDTLTVYQGVALMSNPETRDYLFLPFTDPTNDSETYINGRYLDLKISDITNGKIILDFNKAYNPYCAYGPGWNCPKPPEDNMLDFPVKAGEKQFAGK